MNIVTGSNSLATHFLIYGTIRNRGVLISLDLSPLDIPLCRSPEDPKTDYEAWTPPYGENEQACVMGHSMTYTRRLQLAECITAPDFEHVIVTSI
jgi:hypothetical protein